jgi:hypothetical protein
VSPVRYELGFYIPQDDILHSHRRENLESYLISTSIQLSACCELVPHVVSSKTNSIWTPQIRYRKRKSN